MGSVRRILNSVHNGSASKQSTEYNTNGMLIVKGNWLEWTSQSPVTRSRGRILSAGTYCWMNILISGLSRRTRLAPLCTYLIPNIIFTVCLYPLVQFIDHVVYRTKLKGPAFRCEVEWHYWNMRFQNNWIVSAPGRWFADFALLLQAFWSLSHRQGFVICHMMFISSHQQTHQ